MPEGDINIIRDSNLNPSQSLQTTKLSSSEIPSTYREAQLLELDQIGQNPSMHTFQKALDNGVFQTRTSTQYGPPIEASEEGLLEVLESLKEEFHKQKQNKKAQESVVAIPNGFNMEAEAKAGVRDAIDYIHKTGIVNLDTLVDASLYLGPGNTRVTEGLSKARPNIFEWVRMHAFEEAIPPASTKVERDEYMSLNRLQNTEDVI